MNPYRLAKRTALQLANTIDRLATTVKYRQKVRDCIGRSCDARQFQLSSSQEAEVRSYWERLGLRIRDTSWHRLYTALSGRFDVRYVPEDIYYALLEPRLNRPDLVNAYKDKNLYDRLFSHVRRPVTLLRSMSGEYLGPEYDRMRPDEAAAVLQRVDGVYFIKPSLETGGGKKVQKLVVIGGTAYLDDIAVTLADLERQYGRDFMIQESIEQPEVLTSVYPHSLNTLRVTSLNWKGQVRLSWVAVKFGNNLANTDNAKSGGLWCCVSNGGILGDYAIDNNFTRHTVHPFNGHEFAGLHLDTSSVLPFVASLHRVMPHFKLLASDIAIDRKGHLVLIEVNIMSQGIAFQATNGPMFGDLTEEVITSLLD